MNILSIIKNKLARKARITKAIRELNNLTDRELADVGIPRYDIARVVRGDA